MRVLHEDVSGTDIIIEIDNAELKFNTDSRNTVPASITPEFEQTYTKAKDIIFNIATDMSIEIEKRTKGEKMPNSIEVSFGLGFSQEVGAWVIKASGKQTFSAKLTWNR